MPNPLGLGDIAFNSLFNKKSMHENNRQGLFTAQADEDKYVAGISYINANWRSLYDSLPQNRTQVRNPIHALTRNWLVRKGLTGLERAPAGFWCVTFDLYNRGANASDRNGARRCIALLENWTVPASGGRRSYSSPEGGYFRFLLYSGTHYGDNGTPGFQNISGWPLSAQPGGAYGVVGNVAATFA